MFSFDETRGSNDKTNIRICPFHFFFLMNYESTDVPRCLVCSQDFSLQLV